MELLQNIGGVSDICCQVINVDLLEHRLVAACFYDELLELVTKRFNPLCALFHHSAV